MAWGDRVRLKQGTFQVDKVAQGQHLLSYTLMARQVTVAIREDFGLQDGYNAILLTDAGIRSQNIGIFRVFPNLQHTTLLGKVGSILVLGPASRQLIQPLGGGLAISSCQGHHALVYLNAHNATLGLDNLGKRTSSTAFWYSVTWKRITPPMQRFTQTAAVSVLWVLSANDCSLLAMPPVDSSAARRSLPGVTSR